MFGSSVLPDFFETIRGEPFAGEQRFQSRAVRLRRAAPEILNEVLLHLFIIKAVPLSALQQAKARGPPQRPRRAISAVRSSLGRPAPEGSEAGSPSGSSAVEHRYRLPVEM